MRFCGSINWTGPPKQSKAKKLPSGLNAQKRPLVPGKEKANFCYNLIAVALQSKTTGNRRFDQLTTVTICLANIPFNVRAPATEYGLVTAASRLFEHP